MSSENENHRQLRRTLFRLRIGTLMIAVHHLRMKPNKLTDSVLNALESMDGLVDKFVSNSSDASSLTPTKAVFNKMDLHEINVLTKFVAEHPNRNKELRAADEYIKNENVLRCFKLQLKIVKVNPSIIAWHSVAIDVINQIESGKATPAVLAPTVLQLLTDMSKINNQVWKLAADLTFAQKLKKLNTETLMAVTEKSSMTQEQILRFDKLRSIDSSLSWRSVIVDSSPNDSKASMEKLLADPTNFISELTINPNTSPQVFAHQLKKGAEKLIVSKDQSANIPVKSNNELSFLLGNMLIQIVEKPRFIARDLIRIHKCLFSDFGRYFMPCGSYEQMCSSARRIMSLIAFVIDTGIQTSTPILLSEVNRYDRIGASNRIAQLDEYRSEFPVLIQKYEESKDAIVEMMRERHASWFQNEDNFNPENDDIMDYIIYRSVDMFTSNLNAKRVIPLLNDLVKIIGFQGWVLSVYLWEIYETLTTDCKTTRECLKYFGDLHQCCQIIFITGELYPNAKTPQNIVTVETIISNKTRDFQKSYPEIMASFGTVSYKSEEHRERERINNMDED